MQLQLKVHVLKDNVLFSLCKAQRILDNNLIMSDFEYVSYLLTILSNLD